MAVVSHGPGSAGAPLVMQVDADGDALVVMSGRLTGTLTGEVADRIRSLLRDGDCVLIDVNGLTVDHPALLDVFPAALAQAGGWPAAKLAVISRDAGVRGALTARGVGRLLAVGETVEHVRARCDERPAEVRAGWSLRADRSAPREARQYVQQRLLLWGCPDRAVGNTVQVVNELVSNTVEHAGTAMSLTVTLDEWDLRCAVRDYSAERPTRPARPQVDIGGWGLRIVEALSRSWGCTDHGDGKTVWAVVDSRN